MRLMRIKGWKTFYYKIRSTRIGPAAYKYPYLLRGLAIERTNQLWEIDITYLPMKNGFMYLGVIIDVHKWYVVGWGERNTMTAQWCLEIVEEAIVTNGKRKILYSDQVSQFTIEVYVDLLKKNEI